ncbi:MAG: M48 family metallopeptidase [Opitutaceae bacterium]|jgi:predicted metal-dependent hydrolase|nr:M48 family metallopeptidase [Opitutaceae bacterium]
MTPPDTPVFRRSERARRYRLQLDASGNAVVTLPAKGTEEEARRFVERHREWLEHARARLARRPRLVAEWRAGTRVPWRGNMEEIRPEAGAVRLGADVFHIGAAAEGNLRPLLEPHFQRVARIELPARTWELAARSDGRLTAVHVRAQRTRWGSCSARGAISLNWRLVMAPDWVRDYVICHELAHLRHMNHSNAFWAETERLFPRWREAERWLREWRRLVAA